MNLILTFFGALLFSVLFIPVNIILAKKFKLVDDPKLHKHPAVLHKKIVPRAGGAAIYLAFLIASILSLGVSKKLLGIALGGLVLVAVGIADDKYDLPNWSKLIAQIVAAIIVVGSGIGISFIANPFYLLSNSFPYIIHLDTLQIVFNFLGTHSIIVLADLFAIFWIVWVVNMVNFSAGVDGQLGAIAFVTFMVIFAASVRIQADATQTTVFLLALAGAGATLGFLIFNWAPAKIFPGDSGSYFLGFLIAVLSILSGAKVGTAVLVIAIPLIDGVFTIFRRIAQKKSPFLGDRKHLHHRLLEIGLTPAQVALFYCFLCAILGAAALTFSQSQKLFTGVLVAIIVCGGLLWLNMNLPHGDQK